MEPLADPHREALGQGGPPIATARALGVLRAGIGTIWTLNLLFILDPANEFFPGFSSTATSFSPTALGGPAIPALVAHYPEFFASAILLVTAYLAVAFLLGLTTRVACLTGLAFNSLLLLTQYGQVVMIPGGTDVGPQPLYLLVYATLLVAGGRTAWSIDAWLASIRGVGLAGVSGPRRATDGLPVAPASVARPPGEFPPPGRPNGIPTPTPAAGDAGGARPIGPPRFAG